MRLLSLQVYSLAYHELSEGRLVQSGVFSGINKSSIGNNSLLLEMLKYQVELLESWGIPKFFMSLTSIAFDSNFVSRALSLSVIPE